MATLHASQLNNVIQNNSVSNQSSNQSVSNQTVSFDDLYPNITNEILPKNSLMHEIIKSKTIQIPKKITILSICGNFRL